RVVNRLLRIDGVKRLQHGPAQIAAVAFASNDERHAILRSLLVGPIGLRPLLDIESVVLDVSDDPDDTDPGLIGQCDPEALIDGALARPDRSRDSLVDDTDGFRTIDVAR